MGLLAEARRVALASDDERGGSIVGAGALPAVTVPSFLKAGFTSQALRGNVLARDSSYLMTMGSFFCDTSIEEFALQKNTIAGADSLLVAFDREFVLLFARDAVFFGDQLPVMPM